LNLPSFPLFLWSGWHSALTQGNLALLERDHREQRESGEGATRRHVHIIFDECELDKITGRVPQSLGGSTTSPSVQADVKFKGVHKKVLAGAAASKIVSSPVLSKKLIPDGYMEMAPQEQASLNTNFLRFKCALAGGFWVDFDYYKRLLLPHTGTRVLRGDWVTLARQWTDASSSGTGYMHLGRDERGQPLTEVQSIVDTGAAGTWGLEDWLRSQPAGFFK
jgi:hypothetical protein